MISAEIGRLARRLLWTASKFILIGGIAVLTNERAVAESLSDAEVHRLVAQGAYSGEPAQIPQTSASPDAQTHSLVEQPTDLTLNGQHKGDCVLLWDGDGQWWLSTEDASTWGIKADGPPDRIVSGVGFVNLNRLPGFDAKFDENRQSLTVNLVPTAFHGSALNLDASRQSPIPQKVEPGAFLNYDFFAFHSEGAGASNEVIGNALLETVGFSSYGTASNTALVNNIGDSRAGGTPGRTLRRLDSSWTLDSVDYQDTVVLGDSFGVSGLWGTPVRFGGVRFGTNFATQPGFITRPGLDFVGQTAAPSVVDVFVNGNRVQSQHVETGPFTINDIPLITSGGEARVVVTDLLGREQVLTQRFLTNGTLLKAGLVDYSIEVGSPRRNYAEKDFDYAGRQAVVQYRYGVSNNLTSEFRAENSEGLNAAGLGMMWSQATLGIFSTALVNSQTRRVGNGSQLYLSYERPSLTGLYYAASARLQDRSFRQLGTYIDDPTVDPPSRTLTASVGVPLSGRLSLSAGYVDLERRNAEASRNYSITLASSWRRLSIYVSAIQTDGLERNKRVGAYLSYSFGDNTIASLNHNQTWTHDSRSIEPDIQVQKSVLEGPSWGYRADVGLDAQQPGADDGRYTLSGTWRNDFGTYTAEAGRLDGTSTQRASIDGGISLLGGNIFFSRKVNQSFAFINEPELADVKVYVNSQESGRIDSSGRILVPGLIPYGRNQVRLDLDNAPLDLEVGSGVREVVPGYRTGHRVTFGAHRVRRATLILQSADGVALKIGTVVKIKGSNDLFYVGDRGETYIATSTADPTVMVSTDGRDCEWHPQLPPSDSDLPTLGPFLCGSAAP